MHECEICGMYCDCDCDDLDQPAPINCSCNHEGSGLDEDGVPYDDYEDADDEDYDVPSYWEAR